MTISELITFLQTKQQELGDLPLDFDWGADYGPIESQNVTANLFMQDSILLSFGAD